ncbi:hypothetical protein SORBI_3008G119300 [Sorghum bicolor]|nr:hypothetical protein SORBI_3008G119300 [Sorghum bicolor]
MLPVVRTHRTSTSAIRMDGRQLLHGLSFLSLPFLLSPRYSPAAAVAHAYAFACRSSCGPPHATTAGEPPSLPSAIFVLSMRTEWMPQRSVCHPLPPPPPPPPSATRSRGEGGGFQRVAHLPLLSLPRSPTSMHLERREMVVTFGKV